jgi:hypothetical protein
VHTFSGFTVPLSALVLGALSACQSEATKTSGSSSVAPVQTASAPVASSSAVEAPPSAPSSSPLGVEPGTFTVAEIRAAIAAHPDLAGRRIRVSGQFMGADHVGKKFMVGVVEDASAQKVDFTVSCETVQDVREDYERQHVINVIVGGELAKGPGVVLKNCSVSPR